VDDIGDAELCFMFSSDDIFSVIVSKKISPIRYCLFFDLYVDRSEPFRKISPVVSIGPHGDCSAFAVGIRLFSMCQDFFLADVFRDDGADVFFWSYDLIGSMAYAFHEV